MTNISDERVERRARAMAKLHGSNHWRCWVDDARAALEADAPEIAEAERRGRIEGIKEAKEIALGLFGWDISVWANSTKQEMAGRMAVAITEKIAARLAALLPETAAKREEEK